LRHSAYTPRLSAHLVGLGLKNRPDTALNPQARMEQRAIPAAPAQSCSNSTSSISWPIWVLASGVPLPRRVQFLADALDVEVFEVVRDVDPDAVKAEVAAFQFAAGLFDGPALIEDAVHGRDDAGAVGAVLAVDEHRAVLERAFDGEQGAHDLLVADLPGVHRNAHQFHAGHGEGVFVAMPRPEADDGANAQRLQPGHVALFGLGAAVKLGRDLVQVARRVDGHGPFGGPLWGGAGGLRGRIGRGGHGLRLRRACEQQDDEEDEFFHGCFLEGQQDKTNSTHAAPSEVQ